MKNKRQEKILSIIKENIIVTQDDLQNALLSFGFNVTQSTVSRDIKELRLVKTLGTDGAYRYAPAKAESETISGQFYTLFSDAVQNVDYAGNIVVVRCLPGMAQAVCASMDSMHWKDVVGTLAGDDTFVCFVKNESQAVGLVTELKKLIRK